MMKLSKAQHKVLSLMKGGAWAFPDNFRLWHGTNEYGRAHRSTMQALLDRGYIEREPLSRVWRISDKGRQVLEDAK